VTHRSFDPFQDRGRRLTRAEADRRNGPCAYSEQRPGAAAIALVELVDSQAALATSTSTPGSAALFTGLALFVMLVPPLPITASGSRRHSLLRIAVGAICGPHIDTGGV
jgi:hypothetical protein